MSAREPAALLATSPHAFRDNSDPLDPGTLGEAYEPRDLAVSNSPVADEVEVLSRRVAKIGRSAASKSPAATGCLLIVSR